MSLCTLYTVSMELYMWNRGQAQREEEEAVICRKDEGIITELYNTN